MIWWDGCTARPVLQCHCCQPLSTSCCSTFAGCREEILAVQLTLCMSCSTAASKVPALIQNGHLCSSITVFWLSVIFSLTSADATAELPCQWLLKNCYCLISWAVSSYCCMHIVAWKKLQGAECEDSRSMSCCVALSDQSQV